MKAILGLLILAMSSLASAQGTPSYYEAGMHPGSTGGGYDDFRVWCEDRIRILRFAKNEAGRLVTQGNYAAANQVYERGLVRSFRDVYSTNTPLSQQMLGRAIKTIRELRTKTSRSQLMEKSITYFMGRYIDFIISTINSFDIPYYVNVDCGYCDYGNTRGFEEQYLEIARKKLELVNDTLIGKNSVVPLGPTSLYLKVSEMMSYFSMMDLSGSMFANYYSCQIQDLADLHHWLLGLNNHPSRGSRYYNPRQIVQETFARLERVIKEIGYRSSCGY